MATLITGGTGFLGSYLTRYAIARGERVVVLDLYPDRGRIADVLDEVELFEGDVADPELVGRILADRDITRVAHFAAILGSPRPGRMVPYVHAECVGTANVLEAARVAGVERVVFGSSVAVYGDQPVEQLTEDLIVNPVGPYGLCKAWAEGICRHYAQTSDLQVASLRFGSTYGLGRGRRGSYKAGMLDAQPDMHYMARFEDAARGIAVTMPADDAIADWTYAADAAQASWLALTRPLGHHAYNVASSRGPVGEFTDAMRRVLPDVDIRTVPDDTPGNPHAPMCNRRLVEDLGFQPDYSFDAGITDYVERIRIEDRYEAARHPAGA